MVRSPRKEVATLVYPDHLLKPEDLLEFIELGRFSRDWKTLKLDDEDLLALQVLMCCKPKMGPVVRRTGGLRKGRFSPPSLKSGKRGALRICYSYFEEHHVVLLARAYPKNVKDDLTADERKGIRKLLEHIDAALNRGTYN